MELRRSRLNPPIIERFEPPLSLKTQQQSGETSNLFVVQPSSLFLEFDVATDAVFYRALTECCRASKNIQPDALSPAYAENKSVAPHQS